MDEAAGCCDSGGATWRPLTECGGSGDWWCGSSFSGVTSSSYSNTTATG